MPELPDVEIFRRYFNATALHKTIAGVTVNEAEIVRNISARKFKKLVTGDTFSSSGRHGKYHFAYLDSGRMVVFHYGMTGKLEYYKGTKELRYARVVFSFDNGYRLAYICQRKLKGIRLLEDKKRFISSKRLGPDALEISSEDFKNIMSGRRGMVKTTLMNQRIIAGIGNIYADEILFQAGIHPEESISDLAPGEIDRLYDRMKKVLDTAIECKVDTSRFPSEFLLIVRHEGRDCPRCGSKLKKITVNNRGTIFCPECQ